MRNDKGSKSGERETSRESEAEGEGERKDEGEKVVGSAALVAGSKEVELRRVCKQLAGPVSSSGNSMPVSEYPSIDVHKLADIGRWTTVRWLMGVTSRSLLVKQQLSVSQTRSAGWTGPQIRH